MVKRVTSWESTDGLSFATREAAAEHERLMPLINFLVEEVGLSRGLAGRVAQALMKHYAILSRKKPL